MCVCVCVCVCACVHACVCEYYVCKYMCVHEKIQYIRMYLHTTLLPCIGILWRQSVTRTHQRVMSVQGRHQSTHPGQRPLLPQDTYKYKPLPPPPRLTWRVIYRFVRIYVHLYCPYCTQYSFLRILWIIYVCSTYVVHDGSLLQISMYV